MKQQHVPFVDLKAQYKVIKSDIDRAITSVTRGGQFIGGSDVKYFEQEFASYLGTKHCIAVNSGTDALILGLRALDLSPGDEVIVPVHTFIATALAATENRLTPVFVDADPADTGISLDDLRAKITDKTKAIIVVHLYGRPDKLDDIRAVVRSSGRQIHIIEDACQAHGAEYKGKKAGTIGVFGAFSFYPGKNLGAYGDGGAIVTDDKQLATRYLLLREYGQKVKYHHESLGINSRLDTMQAAILRVKLKQLDSWNVKRQEHARYYTENLSKLGDRIRLPADIPDRKSVNHLYVVETDKRDRLQQFLSDRGITALIHYPIPLHLQNAFSYLQHKRGDFPNAEYASDRILSLPMYPELTKTQLDTVINGITDFIHL